MLVGPGVEAIGTLGQTDLDRVVVRDTLAELSAGITTTRHYGFHGEARRQDVAVFIESFGCSAPWSCSQPRLVARRPRRRRRPRCNT